MVNENKKRVAKNTMMLYLRMLFYMAVSLYTSRVVLQTLGIEDFGIFNVVGGVLSMLGFLNASLTGSTSRFITFALGKNDYSLLRKTFAGTSNLHFGLAIFIVVIAETIGLWFLNTQLIIPENRIVAANWIYQASIISAFIGIAQMPYSSIIVAHEKMNIYAYMGILEVSLKLLIVYLLIISPFDTKTLVNAVTNYFGIESFIRSFLHFQGGLCILHYHGCLRGKGLICCSIYSLVQL